MEKIAPKIDVNQNYTTQGSDVTPETILPEQAYEALKDRIGTSVVVTYVQNGHLRLASGHVKEITPDWIRFTGVQRVPESLQEILGCTEAAFDVGIPLREGAADHVVDILAGLRGV